MALDYPIRYCPKCGEIALTSMRPNEKCLYCGTILQDTEYICYDVIDHGNLKPEIRKAIFEKYIKNSPTYSEEYAKQREEKQTRESMNLPSSYKPKDGNTPKCPICQSTNLSKITNTRKAGKIALFGIFGAGDLEKTWKCNNCGSKF